MTYRDLGQSTDTTLALSLLDGDEFVYAHLVKFEKPIASLGPKPSRAAGTYRYITDASYDITWDDGSQDAEGNNNGIQTYRARALKSISQITESIEAKATSLDLVLAATAIGTKYTTTYTTTSTYTEMSGTIEDFVSVGFMEGDEVTFTTGTNANKILRIERFTNNNKRAYFTVVEGSAAASEGPSALTLKLTSKELRGIILNKEDADYARYINREVYIYKAHIDPDDGTIIGDPFLLFKGIIASGRLTEDPTKESTVSWSVTSHWGDFVTVVGRLTSDDAHRAKTGKGVPDVDALVRPEYANDLGFMHSEQAVNLITTYTAKEIRYKQKKSGGFFSGLLGQKRLVEYEVEVEREVDLKLNLQARYLPVVYGVQKVDSIPVFVDTLESDPATVFVAYAICEGEVHSLYDVYFDDESSICLSEMDQNAREGQETASVQCIGRMDRGDTLVGAGHLLGSVFANVPSFSIAGDIPWGFGDYIPGVGTRYSEPDGTFFFGSRDNGTTQYTQAVGIKHEGTKSFNTPIDTTLTFHSGKPNQKADNLLVDNQSNFKLGNAYFSDSAGDYWSPAHRLLDTAYAVAKYTISEGETQIPALDFVVKGRLVECYNYDYSYLEDPSLSPTSPTTFQIGQTVTLGDGASGTATIAWITQVAQPDGTNRWRVRFTSDPSISSTRFSISYGGAKIYFSTYDAVYQTTTVANAIQENVSNVATGTNVGSNITVSGTDLSSISFLDLIRIAITTASGGGLEGLSNFTTSNTSASSTLEDVGSTSAGSGEPQSVIARNAVKLSAGSTSDDAYNGLRVKVTRTFSDGSQYIQDKEIVDYRGSTRIAITDSEFHPDYIPTAGDAVVVYSSGDRRVSTNPVMQLLDYITNERFGRKLSLEEDINLDSWMAAARKCDTRSKVRIKATGNPTVGDVYSFTAGGNLKFRGTVADTTSLGGGNYEVVFDNVIGKLCYKWNNWRTYKDGDLYWHNGYLNQKSGDGTVTTAPTSTGYGTLNLARVSGSGPNPLGVSIAESTWEGNPVVKEYSSERGGFVSGYDLYDSDDVVYWRYVGWETPDQEYVTRHQTNIVINTSSSVFDNINNFLGHFNGILRYNAGKYEIDVASEKGADVIIGSYTPSAITEDDIIGAINIEDSGSKNTFNHASCTLVDPANKFEGRSATYLNSNYLKEDRNIVKKGNVKTPGITNYYNARLNAKQFLDESRYGLSINFTMPPKGILLLAGEIITITHTKLDFTDKPFRITNVSLKPNGLVQINAYEHMDEAYVITGTQADVGGVTSSAPAPAPRTVPNPVDDLTATRLMGGGIELTWTEPDGYLEGRDTFEIYRSTESHFSTSPAPVFVARVNALTYIDNPSGDISTVQVYYYWIRVRRSQEATNANSITRTYSTYYPNIADSPEPAGILGQNYLGMTGINIHIANPVSIIPLDTSTSPPTPDLTATDTTVTVTMNGAKLDFDNTSPQGVGTFNLTVNDYFGLTIPGTITADTASPPDPKLALIGDIGDFSAFDSYALVDYTVTVVDWDGGTYVFELSQSYSPVAGSQGLDGYNTAVVLCYKRSATQPGGSPSDSPTNGSDTITYTFATGAWSSGPFNGWSTTIPSQTSPPTPCWVTGQTAISQDATDNFIDDDWTVAVQVFSDGDTGADADYIIITGERLFMYEPGNSTPTNGGTLELSAQLFGQLTNYQWQYFDPTPSPGSWNNFTGGTSATYNLTHDHAAWESRDTLRVRCVSGTANDEFTVSKLYANSNAFTVELSNSAHTIPMPYGGSPNTGDYTNSGLDIRVWYGITPCPYDDTPSYSTPSFRVTSASASNITVDPTPTTESTYIRRWGPADDITAATATITFTIVCVDDYGNESTFTRVQSFSRVYEGDVGADAQYVVVNGEHVFHYASDASTPDTTSIVLSAQLFGGLSGYDWEYLDTTVSPNSWTNFGSPNTNETYTLDYDDAAWGGEPPTGVSTLTIRCKDGTGSYYDTFTVIKTFDGATGSSGGDAIVITLSNETHTIPTDSSGNNPVFTNSGTEIYVYEGVDILNYDGVGTSNGTWTVSATPNNVTPASPTSGGSSPDAYAIYGPLTGITADTGYIDFTVSGKRSDGTAFSGLVKRQTFAKSYAGTQGLSGAQGLQGGTGLQGTGGIQGAEGYEALAPNYSNTAVAVNVDTTTSPPTADWTGSGGDFWVWEGGTKLGIGTTATNEADHTNLGTGEFKLYISKVSGDTLTIPGATDNVDYLTLANWSGTLTQVTVYRLEAWIVTYQDLTITLSLDVTFTPVYDGDDGLQGLQGGSGTQGLQGGGGTQGLQGGTGLQGIQGIYGTQGLQGDAGEAADAIAINYTNTSHPISLADSPLNWTGSGGNFYVIEGGTKLILNQNTQVSGSPLYTATPGEYNLNIVKISGDTLTEPTITGQNTDEATLSDWGGDLTQTTVYRIYAYITTSNSDQIFLTTDVTFTPVVSGTDGLQGASGSQGLQGSGGTQGTEGLDGLAINYTNNSHTVSIDVNTSPDTVDWTGSGGKFYILEGGTFLTYNAESGTYPGTTGRYNLQFTKISGDTLTTPTITGGGTTEATFDTWGTSGTYDSVTVYRVTAWIRRLDGTTTVQMSQDITLTPSFWGYDGTQGLQGGSGTQGLQGGGGTQGLQGTGGTQGLTGASGTALIINGGFETGDITGWEAVGAVSPQTSGSISSTYARNGTYSLRVPEGGGGPNHWSNLFPVSEGDSIRVTGYAYPGAGLSANCAIQIRWFDSAGNNVNTDSVGTADYTVSSWQKISNTLTVPVLSPEVTQAAVDCGEANGSTGYWYFDSLSAVLQGTEGLDGLAVNYTNDSHQVEVDENVSPTTYDWNGSGGDFYVYEGANLLDFNTAAASFPAAAGSFNLDFTKLIGDTLTGHTTSAITAGGANIADWDGQLTQTTIYRITAWIRRLDGTTTVTMPVDATLVPSWVPADGSEPNTVFVSASSYTIKISDNGITPEEVTLTAALTGTLSTYQWQYVDTWGTWQNITGETSATFVLTHNADQWGTNAAHTTQRALRLRCVSGAYNDEVTINKLYDVHGENLVRNGGAEWLNIGNWGLIGGASDLNELTVIADGTGADGQAYFKYSATNVSPDGKDVILCTVEDMQVDVEDAVYEWSMYIKTDSPPSPAIYHLIGLSPVDEYGANVNTGRAWKIEGTDAQLYETITGTNPTSIKIKPIIGKTFNWFRDQAFYDASSPSTDHNKTSNPVILYGDSTGPVTEFPVESRPNVRYNYIGDSSGTTNYARVTNNSNYGDYDTVDGSTTGWWTIYSQQGGGGGGYYYFNTGKDLADDSSSPSIGGKVNDWISLSGEGGTYMYLPAGAVATTSNWVKYYTYISGQNAWNEHPVDSKFRPNKGIRWMNYINYQVVAGEVDFLFDKCSLRKIPAVFTGYLDNETCNILASTNGLVGSSQYPITGGTFRTFLDGQEVTTSGDVTYTVDSITGTPSPGMVTAYITMGTSTGVYVANNIPQDTTEYSVTYKAVFSRGGLTRTLYKTQTVKIDNYPQGQLTLVDYSDGSGIANIYGEDQITIWNAAGWDLCVYSDEAYTGPVRLDFKTYGATQTNQSFMVGFSDYSDMSSGDDHARVAAAFYFQQNYGGGSGNPGISYWSDTGAATGIVDESVTPHTANDVWSLIWNGRSYTMLKNGAYFAGPYKPASTPAYHRLFIAFGGNATTDGVTDISMIGTGLRTATAYLYQRTTTSSAPGSLPASNHTYTFSTQVVSGSLPDNGWQATVPTASTSDYLWVTTATAISSLDTDTIYPAEWSTAALITTDGAPASWRQRIVPDGDFVHDTIANATAITSSNADYWTTSGSDGGSSTYYTSGGSPNGYIRMVCPSGNYYQRLRASLDSTAIPVPGEMMLDVTLSYKVVSAFTSGSNTNYPKAVACVIGGENASGTVSGNSDTLYYFPITEGSGSTVYSKTVSVPWHGTVKWNGSAVGDYNRPTVQLVSWGTGTGYGTIDIVGLYAEVSTAANLVYQPAGGTTYSTVEADSQKRIIYMTGNVSITASIPYPIGTILTFVNRAGATKTITLSSGSLYKAGDSSTTNPVTLNQNAIANAVKTDSTVWVISGMGIQ